MKINRAIPIEKLMEALDYYMENTNRRLTLEYILLKGVNDHREDAKQLASLFKDKRQSIYVNLIPYNPVDEHIQYERSEKESVLTFYDTLKKNGINCEIRQEQGTDIDAACGQLRSKQMKKQKVQITNIKKIKINKYSYLNNFVTFVKIQLIEKAMCDWRTRITVREHIGRNSRSPGQR